MTGPASVKPSRKSAKPTDDDSFDSGSGQSESEYKGSDGDDYADEDEDESPRVASSSELVITNGRATKVEKVGGRPKNYGCPFDGCSKSYTRPVRLEEHVRSHTGEVSIHSLKFPAPQTTPSSVLWGGQPFTPTLAQRVTTAPQTHQANMLHVRSGRSYAMSARQLSSGRATSGPTPAPTWTRPRSRANAKSATRGSGQTNTSGNT